MKRHQSSAERLIDAPRALVWAVISDTNRSDRAMGLAAATYRWDDDGSGKRVRVAAARELGQDLEWIEPPYRWIEARFVEGRRRFIKGPVSAGGFEARVEDVGEAQTRVRVTAWVETEGVFGAMLGPIQRMRFASSLARYLDAVEAVFMGWRELDLGGVDEPAAVRIKRLIGGGYDAITSGPRTEPNRELLARRAETLYQARLDRAVVDQLISHLRDRPDEEVQQMRPFELARGWGLDRREVVRAFLHATVAGLTDLRWQINCPVCRVGASVVQGLDGLGVDAHCDACQIRFDTDFAQHVEAVFTSNRAIRPVEVALYCASSPAFLPHVLAQVAVDPGETIEEQIDLPKMLHARILGRDGGVHLTLEEIPAMLRVRADVDGVELRPEGVSVDGSTTLSVENPGETPVVVLLERAGWSADAVLGNVIGSMQEFHDLFASEAPASGVDLRVGQLVLLFSDLVGSTALYERVGDARAFAIVGDHFQLMRQAVEGAGGAVVKTMGDAVMATFPSMPDAVAAARRMIETHELAHSDGDLGVKIGVYEGPCLAVRANDRLDFFGTTVNMAARLQAQASAGEMVITASAALEPSLAAHLSGRARREFQAALKGIEAEQGLVGVDFRSA